MTSGFTTRTFDRMIGIFVTIASGLALIAARTWIKNMMEKCKKKRESGDEVHRTRYAKANTVQHMGACHCQRIRFRVRAPRVIHAVDVPSKIRFPRISVPCDFFEPLTDEAIMSLYAVKTDETGMGVHTFCSYCGVHVLYSPSIEPTEVQINVDCLDRSTIEHVYVSYISIPDSLPCSVTYEAARPFNRRGAGSLYVPILSSLCSPTHKASGSQQGSAGRHSGGSDQKAYGHGSGAQQQHSPYDFNPAIWGTVTQPFSNNFLSSGGSGYKGSSSGSSSSGSSGNAANALNSYYMGFQGGTDSSSGNGGSSNGGGTAVGDDTHQVDGLFQWGLQGVNNYVAGLDVDRYHHTLSPTPRKLRAEPQRLVGSSAGSAGVSNWTPQYRQLRNHLAQYLPPHLAVGASPPSFAGAEYQGGDPRVSEVASM